jgi:SMODS-associating 4TM effector domain
MWAEILTGASDENVTRESRELQDEIFDHRRRNPLIFDWIYNLLRDGQEEQMNRAAAGLIEEAQTRLRLDHDKPTT